MKNKYLILIPALFLLASCGTATDARVQFNNNANDESAEKYPTIDDIYEILESGLRNCAKITKSLYQSVDKESQLAIDLGWSYNHLASTETETEEMIYFEDDYAYSYEFSSIVEYESFGVADYYYSANYDELIKGGETDTFSAIYKTFKISEDLEHGVNYADYNSNKFPVSDKFEDLSKAFKSYFTKDLAHYAALEVAHLSNKDMYDYKVDGNKIIFSLVNEIYNDYTYNPLSGTSPYIPSYVDYIEVDNYEYVFEKVEDEYRYLGYSEDESYYLVQDFYGNYLEEPMLICSGSITSTYEYTKQTGYQHKNFLDFDYYGSDYIPVMSEFSSEPITTLTTDTSFTGINTSLYTFNDTIQTRRAIDLPDNQMIFICFANMHAGTIFSFESAINYDAKSALAEYEVVNLAGDAFEVKNIKGSYTIIKCKEDIEIMFKIEVAIEEDTGKGAKSDIQKVTIIPSYN